MVPSNVVCAFAIERRLRLLTVAGLPLGWYPMAFQKEGSGRGVRIIVTRPSLPEIQASLDMIQRVVAHLVSLSAGMRKPEQAITCASWHPASVCTSMETMTCGPAGRYLFCSNSF